MSGMYSYHRVIALLLGGIALLLSTWAAADPPTRVMRLGYTSGAVNLMESDKNDWSPATINLPVIAGDRLWAGSGARAELQLGTAAIRMDRDTSASIINFDDRYAQFQLDQGRLNLRVRSLAADEVIEVDTPNLAFTIRRPGEYSIEVNPDDNSTTVTALYGQAEAYSENTSYLVEARTSYRFFGTGLRDYEFLNIPPADDFERWASERERRWADSTSANYVSRDMIGYEDLDAYGNWSQTQDYGYVWYPNKVSVNWSPYYYGRWAWYDPWGWTWVDDAPWGFAVSHYGRWTHLNRRWCWVPGPIAARPVYAPALVVFVGGNHSQWGFRTGSVGGVGWFPLAPREVYRPSYRVSQQYFTAINSGNTTVNITNVYNNTSVRNVTYVNQRVPGAVIAMPSAEFTKSQRVSRVAVRLPKTTVTQVEITPSPSAAPSRGRTDGAMEPRHRQRNRAAPETGATATPAPSTRGQATSEQSPSDAPIASNARPWKAEQRAQPRRSGQYAGGRAEPPATASSAITPSDRPRHRDRPDTPPAADTRNPEPVSTMTIQPRPIEQSRPSRGSGYRTEAAAPQQAETPAMPRNQGARRESREPPPPVSESIAPAPEAEAYSQGWRTSRDRQSERRAGGERFRRSTAPEEQ